jgi:hypothetical protein
MATPSSRLALLRPSRAFLDVREIDGEALSPEIVWQVKKAGAAAIERILAAVGKKHTPLELDREALRIEIGEAYLERRFGFDATHGSTARGRLKRLRRWQRAAERLAAQIKADMHADIMIQQTLDRAYSSGSPPPASPAPFSESPLPLSTPRKPPKVVGFLEELQLAIRVVEHRVKSVADKWERGHERDPSLKGRRPTEEDWLAGVELPLVFERHFLHRAGRSRAKSGSGPPTGPMVDFISAAMRELGFKYTKESIARAYTRREPLRKERRRDDTLAIYSRQI